MWKKLICMFAILATAAVFSGCGGGSSTTHGCLKNPWLAGCDFGGISTAILMGAIKVPGDLVLSKQAGAGREAALTSTQALPDATVYLYLMNSSGALAVVSGVSSVTADSSGNFTFPAVPAGTNMIVQATLTVGSDTYFVGGIVSVTTASYGSSVSTELNTETTMAVQGLNEIITAYNTGKTEANKRDASDWSASQITDGSDSLTGIITSNLQTEVSAGNVSLTDFHTSQATRITQYSNLKTNVSTLSTLVDNLTGADATPPTGPTYVYDGTSADIDTATDTTQLSANWDAATDAESGISAYYYAIGTSSGASDTVTWTNNSSGTSVTKTGLSLTVGTTYYVSVKAENGSGLFGTVKTSDGVTIQASGDTTAPTVSSFSPVDGATNVPVSGAVFKVIFSESMKSSVNLNNQATLTASLFSISLQRVDTSGNTIIDATNALLYGTFAWTTTTSTDDTLSFTLYDNATLLDAGLKILFAGKTYNITGRTVPINLMDAAGNALTDSGIATIGSFTVTTDSTPPQVSSFYPSNGYTNISNNSPVFKVIFNETMDHTINLNIQATLTASGFSISLQKVSTGGTLTINAANALSYGSFYIGTTNVPNDTLGFILKDNTTLSGLGLKTISANTTYNITSRTVPTNLKDHSGNALDMVTNIPTTGSFTTLP